MALRIVVTAGREHLFDVLQDGKEPPDHYPLREGQTLEIGRSVVNGIRVAIDIGRFQARVELKDGVARILNHAILCGILPNAVALNGVYLDENDTQWVPLVPGDEIQLSCRKSIGNVTLKLEEWEESG